MRRLKSVGRGVSGMIGFEFFQRAAHRRRIRMARIAGQGLAQGIRFDVKWGSRPWHVPYVEGFLFHAHSVPQLSRIHDAQLCPFCASPFAVVGAVR
jgi:hypothetical protein